MIARNFSRARLVFALAPALFVALPSFAQDSSLFQIVYQSVSCSIFHRTGWVCSFELEVHLSDLALNHKVNWLDQCIANLLYESVQLYGFYTCVDSSIH